MMPTTFGNIVPLVKPTAGYGHGDGVHVAGVP